MLDYDNSNAENDGGKQFEKKAYGQDIDRNNAKKYVEEELEKSIKNR